MFRHQRPPLYSYDVKASDISLLRARCGPPHRNRIEVGDEDKFKRNTGYKIRRKEREREKNKVNKTLLMYILPRPPAR